MILIPTLELLSGNLVRLVGGPEHEATILSDDPLQSARELRRAGAMFLHIVDLDAVFGRGNNNAVLERLAEDLVPFQIRGGVRTAKRAAELLQLGADRVVLGDLPFHDWSAARKLVQKFGLRVVATLDVKDDHVLTDAKSKSRIPIEQALGILHDTGVEHIIYNSVESAGEDGRIDLPALGRVISHGAFQVHVRCTAHTPEQLEPLFELQSRGLRAVILNHALAPECLPFEHLLQGIGAGSRT